ncbi:PfkB family carbohydrate kinase [Clostridium bowmanii]|uniref:PfkB family carbohydrate kinase n=1 Tax=Clostridium bowmanii TaxID=132925 RepID=UPI001C0AA71D|nr:PfkB family carbohydrate kinase [Clostridium bowmanii]MBU3188813.1 winged helix-turn-helix transcriptional regulator [Clostridium bowmanii]MCA1073396.1 PfkB family carbohydrate kinase [Clostridium bowmanii]
MTERELEILKIIKQDPLISQYELADILGITRSGAAAHIHNLTRKGYIKGKGYVLSEPRFITVVGGVNIDTLGTSRSKLIHDNSNPGKIVHLLGGAGRNIALALTKLGISNFFISVFGDDLNGEKFLDDAKENNMNVQYCEKIKGEATSSFISINDSDGNRIVGIDDMDIYHNMTPAFIEKNLDRINHSDYCIIDTNLPKEVIDYIYEKVTIPLVVKTVSLNKSYRLINNIQKIEILIITPKELSQLVSELNETYININNAIDLLLNKGVKNVLVFSASKGLFFKNQSTEYKLKIASSSIINTNGASATLTGTLICGLQNNMEWEEALKYAYVAAISSMETQTPVNPNLSQELLKEKKKFLFPNN